MSTRLLPDAIPQNVAVMNSTITGCILNFKVSTVRMMIAAINMNTNAKGDIVFLLVQLNYTGLYRTPAFSARRGASTVDRRKSHPFQRHPFSASAARVVLYALGITHSGVFAQYSGRKVSTETMPL